MKKLLTIIFVAGCLSASAQDTTITQLSCKARLVQTLAPFVFNLSQDTAYFNLLVRWIKKWDLPLANQPTGTQQVVTDSISVLVIAALYNKAMSYPQGSLAVGSDFAADVLAIRNANAYLDRLLDAIDLSYSNLVPDDRTRGRKRLTIRNQ